MDVNKEAIRLRVLILDVPILMEKLILIIRAHAI